MTAATVRSKRDIKNSLLERCRNRLRLDAFRVIREIRGQELFLKIEKMLFSSQATSVATELPVLINNPMAGDDDGDSIRAICVTDGALCIRRANPPRYVFV